MAQEHLIHRQILEFSFPSKKEAMDGQHVISQIFQNELTPLISALFDELVSPDEHLRIDQLEVDLGRISNFTLTDDLRASLARKLEDELLKTIRGSYFTEHRNGDAGVSNTGQKSESVTIESVRHSDLELFRMFIQTGQLPWWGEIELLSPPEKLVQKLVKEQPERLAKELERLLRTKSYSRRLIYQLPDDILQELWGLIQPEWSKYRLESLFNLQAALLQIHHQSRVVPLNDNNFRMVIWQATFDFGLRYSSSLSFGSFKISSPERPTRNATNVPYRSLARYFGLSQGRSGDQTYLLFLLNELTKKGRSTGPSLDQLGELLSDIKAGAKKLGMKQGPLAKAVKNLSDLDSQIMDLPKYTTDELQESESPEKHEGQKGKNKNRPILKMDLEEGVQIENAGLIIFAPFLPRFFENLGLVSEGKFITEIAIRRGCLLLQYLITGEEHVPEYELLLNKVLCGLPIDEPLARSLEVSDREQQEMDDLLESVITHWEALKNTSVQGLRDTFLKREGLLSEEANGWKLLVERQTVDVLLDRLPWSISIIKMPWNDKLIQVEW